TRADIDASIARDPLVATARLLLDAGLAEPSELLTRYDEIGWEVRRVAGVVVSQLEVGSGAQWTGPLAPRRPVRDVRAVADYAVTKGLRDRFGAGRVFDTLLDETSVLGLGLGSGLAGLLPVPEIQYLAYLHNAEDQLRGEAATMQFFSQGAYRNPMVLRVAGL